MKGINLGRKSLVPDEACILWSFRLEKPAAYCETAGVGLMAPTFSQVDSAVCPAHLGFAAARLDENHPQVALERNVGCRLSRAQRPI